MAAANTLAYSFTATITASKSFMVQAMFTDKIKLIFLINDPCNKYAGVFHLGLD
jgi:hypothetical protein